MTFRPPLKPRSILEEEIRIIIRDEISKHFSDFIPMLKSEGIIKEKIRNIVIADINRHF